MVLAIVLVVLGLASVAAFVLTLRLARRPGDGLARRTPTRPAAAGIDRLRVGAELAYDDQRWDVRGVQHAAPAAGAAWSAWHLDDRGQSGWMVTTDEGAEVLFAVRAERPETLDGAREALRWREHEWVRTEATISPVDAEGERRVPRGPLVPVPDAAVERSVFERPDLPSRRLVLERPAGDGAWNAWVGGLVPAAMIDVWPGEQPPTEASPPSPAPGPGAPGPQPS